MNTIRNWFLPPLFVLLFVRLGTWVVTGKKIPEASSTALKIHKLYTIQPPHDIDLYSTLQVSPNATQRDIQSAYRRLSRNFHPDKQRNNDRSPEERQRELQKIREAFEILSDDRRRLAYHQYGLKDPSFAVIILLGPHHHHHNAKTDALHRELLELMGYNQFFYSSSSKVTPSDQATARTRTVAARLIEQIRPIIEGRIDSNMLAHEVAKSCDRWKSLPLGAQIIRCIGRAYRHAGQDYLRNRQGHSLQVAMRQRWRNTKHYLAAAIATGRATVTERIWTQQARHQRKKETKDSKTLELEHHGSIDVGAADFLDFDSDVDDPFAAQDGAEDAIKHDERLRARQTLLQSLQVEALWKISKVDLDKTIREACQLILSGECFFFPSHQSTNPAVWYDEKTEEHHGWVGDGGKVVNADEAKLEAAHALILIGGVMVQRSKDGTSWKA